MKLHKHVVHIIAAAAVSCLLAISLFSCTFIPVQQEVDDPIADLLADDLAYKYGAIPQGTPGEEIVYPVYEASTMQYTLERADLKPFHRCIYFTKTYKSNLTIHCNNHLNVHFSFASHNAFLHFISVFR